ncbi:hypothetical protein OG242_32785 (plasmid) [Streptomyces sp. NBC_00727]|uniref:hypothetical protein n=1 Tax=Streptomyces sp. NBC_00727 TaxID=2903675 RepID=UPI003868D069
MPPLPQRDVSAAVHKVRKILRKDSRGRTTVLDSPEVRADFAAALDVARDTLLVSEVARAEALLARWNTPPRRTFNEAPGLSPQTLKTVAVAVRGALKKAAREQRTTSWEGLKRQLGSALPSMTAAERTKVLTLVDEGSASADQPLLSVLVAMNSPALAQTYRQVALNLGLEMPSDDDGLADVIRADSEHLHRYWRDR